MLPPPEGLWGMPAESPADIAGLRPRCAEEPRGSPRDHAAARLRARQPARRQGVDAQHPALPRSGGHADRPAEGDLHRRRARHRSRPPTGSRRSRARITRSGSNGTDSGVDDPDQQLLRELRLRRGPQLHRLLQSRARQADRPAIAARPIQEKRKQLVWEIERELAEDGARPVIFYTRGGDLLAALGQGPDDRWSTASINGWRMEDVWLDK